VSQASQKRKNKAISASKVLRNVKEISFIALAAIATYLAIALLSYHPADPGWSQAVSNDQIQNHGGVVGAWIANILLYLFGYLGYLFPFILAFDGWRIFKSRDQELPLDHFHLGLRIVGFIMLLAGACGLAWLHFRSGA
jgi:S-DNA-T family DNA segregation ATPase FtsK/SpoIIIE